LIKISEENYLFLFEKKKNKFVKEFEEVNSLEYFQSPHHSYRHRAEFQIIKKNNEIFYAMTINSKHEVINSFPIASKEIQDVMMPLRELINTNSIMSQKIFQVEFQSSRNNETMVSLIYHKKLDDEWSKIASDISSKLKISIIGRSKNQKIIIGHDYVTEEYKSINQSFKLDLYEQCFSQTNPDICDQMINWIEGNGKKDTDIIELHCGIGTFTIPLSRLFRNVIATENSRPSLVALKKNINLKSCNNIKYARLSGKETLEAYEEKREFRRLIDKNIYLKEYNIKSIFADPPREGIDKDTISKISHFDEIIYISCGFESLKRDLDILKKTHKIKKAAMFDQFPYTDHIESGVILERITPAD